MSDPEWFDGLPEEIQSAPYFKVSDDGTVRSVDQIVADLNNAANLQGNLSDSHIRIPPKDAAEEDIAKFRDRVMAVDGDMVRKPDDFSPVPSEADGYKYSIEDVEFDDAEVEKVRAVAAQNKWTEAQFQGYMENLAVLNTAGLEAQQEWKNAQSKALDEKLGAAREEHLSRTYAAIEDMAPEALIEAMRAGDVDANVMLLVDGLVHKMIDMGAEGGEFERQANSGARTPTREEALSRCTEIRNQMREMQPSNPEYNRLNQKLVEFQALARGAA